MNIVVPQFVLFLFLSLLLPGSFVNQQSAIMAKSSRLEVTGARIKGSSSPIPENCYYLACVVNTRSPY
jgi:hypothetical protein